MIRLLVSFLFLAFSLPTLAAPAEVPPESVVVLYNSAVPNSKELSDHYARLRKIPRENLIGLNLPDTETISRVDYDAKIRQPLIGIFDNNEWWKRQEDAAGLTQPVANKIRFMVCMRGVPFKIERTPATIPEDQRNRKRTTYSPNPQGDEASVDGELSLVGVEGYSIAGPLKNPYFQKEVSLMNDMVGLIAVARIDGPSWGVCKRMMDDAVATEKDGLWGMCYLDLAKKGPGYELGDQWIENIAKANAKLGIPTVIDRNRDTFVTNYPMRDAALYFGWYANHANGPFLNPEFRFPRGAIAVHLHSYSAHRLRSPKLQWCGPLLNRGAAATLGNVYEPYLTLTHHFDVFYARLLQGYTLGEAAYMAAPAISWQAIVLGDPLYRPFLANGKVDLNSEPHRDYKTLVDGWKRFGAEPDTLVTKMRTAAARLNSGLLYEAVGLHLREENQMDQAAAFFASAERQYLKDSDKLRQRLHLADMDRQAGQKQKAITRLLEAKAEFSDIPEAKAPTALVTILDPPAPPPVKVPK